MNKRSLLEKTVSLLLLVVLLIGITPKRTLHNLFANHKDDTSKLIYSSTQQLNSLGYKCNCDDLVVDSPFTSTSYFSISGFFCYSHLVVYPDKQILAKPHLFLNLRGPPVKV